MNARKNALDGAVFESSVSQTDHHIALDVHRDFTAFRTKLGNGPVEMIIKEFRTGFDPGVSRKTSLEHGRQGVGSLAERRDHVNTSFP